MIAELVNIARTALAKWHGAQGTAVIVTGNGMGGKAIETEMAHPPGLYSRPPRGFRGVFLPIGKGRRYGLVIGGINYSLSINISEGETVLYSTDSAGAIKATIALDASGNIKLNGDSKRLVTWQELQNVLNLLYTALTTTPIIGTGAPQPVWTGITGLDISAAKTTTLKTGG